MNAPAGLGGEFAGLAPGGLVYFHADVARALPILAHVTLKNVNMKQTMGLLEKVDYLSGAMYPKPRTLLLHAWRRKGRIPGGGVLALSPQWKRAASQTGARYWHSPRRGLSVSIQKNHALVSDGDPFIEGPPITPPEHLAGPPAPVVGWVENAGVPINRFLSGAGLPIRIPAGRVLFALEESSAAPAYAVLLRVETQNASQARALTAILALVRGLGEIPETFRPLLANPPVQDGADLLIRTGPMTAEGIALLLSRLAIYSP